MKTEELNMFELITKVCDSKYTGRPAEVTITRDGLFRACIRYRGINDTVIRTISGSGADLSACFKQCLDAMADDTYIVCGDVEDADCGCGQNVFSATLESSPQLAVAYTSNSDCTTIQVEGDASGVQGTFLAALDSHLNSRKCTVEISGMTGKLDNILKPV